MIWTVTLHSNGNISRTWEYRAVDEFRKMRERVTKLANEMKEGEYVCIGASFKAVNHTGEILA